MFSTPHELLQSFLGNNNTIRAAAERQLYDLAHTKPNASIDLYISALDFDDSKLVELAAISIKEYHLQNSEKFELIDSEKLEALSRKILQILAGGVRPLKVCKRLVEILVSLYCNNNDGFSDLITNMLAMQNTENSNVKISIMYFVEIFCVHCFEEDYLTQLTNDLSLIFDKFITDNDKNVSIATIRALCSFLSNIEDKKIVQRFSQVLPILLQILVDTIKQDEDLGISIIQAVQELIETHPSFIKPALEDIFTVFSEILLRKQFSNGIRIIARFCDVAVRRCQNFKAKIVPAYVQILCEVSQLDIEEWQKDFEGKNLSKGTPCFVAQDSLEKLADPLTSKFLLPLFMPFITEGIQNSQWEIAYVCYKIVEALIPGSSEFFEEEFDQLMLLVLPGLAHQDPRVVNSTLETICVLSSEYSPTLQEKYHSQIIGSLIQVMNSDTYLKLQLQSIKTIKSFCEEIISTQDEKIMILYIDQLLRSLVGLIPKSLNQNLDILLQEVLDAIAMISSILDVQFVKYYTEIMPILKQLLENVPNTDEKRAQIRVSTIECLGAIITSVRNEAGFEQEIDQIMEYLITLQQKLDKNDIEHAAIFDVYCKVSFQLRHNFTKYMPFIFEIIIEQTKIKVGLISDKKDNPGQIMTHIPSTLMKKIDYNSVNPDVYSLDVAALTINLSAINTLFVLSRNLGKTFYPYIKDTLDVIAGYFDHFSKSLSRKALKTVKNLLMACENEPDVVDILHVSIPTMLDLLKTTLTTTQNVSQSEFILSQVYKCLRILTGPYLREDLVLTLINWIIEATLISQKEKEELAGKYKALEEYDEEKKREFQKEYEEINGLMETVTNLVETLLKLYRENLEEIINTKIAKTYLDTLNNAEASESEVLYTIRFFSSFLQYCSLQTFNQMGAALIPYLIQICRKPASYNALQVSLSGICIIAKRMDKMLFKQLKNDVLSLISEIFGSPHVFNEERMASTDTATKLLGTIALFQYELNDPVSEEITLKFLQLLPLKHDVDEAQATHKMLLEEIQRKNEFLLSMSQGIQENLVKTVQIIQKVDASDPAEEILDDYGRELINKIVSNL